MRIAILQNHAAAGPGLVGDFIAREGWRQHILMPDDLLASAARVSADAYVFLGSADAVYHTHIAWIAKQRALMSELLRDNAPVRGLCFGAQLIAVGLGGTVALMARPFREWMENEYAVDSVWRGPWLRWHEDALTVPAGVQILARDSGTVQAFQSGRALGVQFHPEVSGEVLRHWQTDPHFREEPAASEIRRALEHVGNDDTVKGRAMALVREIFARILAGDGRSR